jgi:hypothetical protein
VLKYVAIIPHGHKAALVRTLNPIIQAKWRDLGPFSTKTSSPPTEDGDVINYLPPFEHADIYHSCGRFVPFTKHFSKGGVKNGDHQHGNVFTVQKRD